MFERFFPPTLKVIRVHFAANLPKKNNVTDAAYDLFAAVNNTVIPVGSIVKIPTGVSIELPKGYQAFIWDRSSMGAKGLKVFGGVIDNGYRGEIIVCLGNFGKEDYVVEWGNKIAQMALIKTGSPKVLEVNELSMTARGNKGFGSSGV